MERTPSALARQFLEQRQETVESGVTSMSYESTIDSAAITECQNLIEAGRFTELMRHIGSLLNDDGEAARIDELADKDGYTLLHMACFRNKTKTIEAIIAKA